MDANDAKARSGAGPGGVVLAAGRSTRMGRPKPLLRQAGRTFLELAVTALREGGCRPVIAVIGGTEAGASDREERAAREAGAAVVLNADPGSEQVDSLRLGLRSLPPDATGAVVLPVDHPLVRAATVRALVDGHTRQPDAVLRAAHDGRPGHPTLFPRAAWPGLFREPLPEGARSVLDDPMLEVVDVPVDDAGVLADIDTPEAYARWVDEA